MEAVGADRVAKTSGHCREFVLGYDVRRSVQN